RHVLGLVAVAHATHDVRVNTLEVRLVEIREPGRVPLRRFHQQALLPRIGSSQSRLRHHGLKGMNRRAPERLRGRGVMEPSRGDSGGVTGVPPTVTYPPT